MISKTVLAQLNTTGLYQQQAKLEEAVRCIIHNITTNISEGLGLTCSSLSKMMYEWDKQREHAWFITDDTVLMSYVEPTVDNQAVLHPKHYDVFPGVEAIEVIASSMTKEEFRGYCKGNMLKYRLRAGNKDSLEQDIAKANTYITLYNKYEHLAN